MSPEEFQELIAEAIEEYGEQRLSEVLQKGKGTLRRWASKESSPMPIIRDYCTKKLDHLALETIYSKIEG